MINFVVIVTLMIIRLPLRFEGSKGEKVLYAFFDSGAGKEQVRW
jgi:hypothetical protein